MTKTIYMPEFVKSVKEEGFKILCASNGKTLRTALCPKCDRRKQVTLLGKKGKHAFYACPCGYRKAC